MNKLLTALLAGVVIGLLIAPDKGSETWKRIKNWATDYMEDMEDALTEVGENVQDKIGKRQPKARIYV